MKISKKAEYGLRAMICLAKGKNKKAFSIREISNLEHVPFDYLGKIFSSLEKAKLVEARLGINGGFFLARPASKISAGDVVGLLENTVSVDCTGCGKSKDCVSKNVWNKIDLAIEKTLSDITLADLIK